MEINTEVPENTKIEPPYDPVIPHSGINQKE
jgi:hypothetical protein